MKKLTNSLIARLAAAAVLTATAACSGAAGPNQVPATPPAKVAAAKPATGNLLQQIKAEIGDAACDTSQQCKSLPVGHRACGGPETYLPWSTKRSNAQKLERLGAQYAKERQEKDTKAGMVSTCQMMMDPGATCSAGRCVSSQGVNAAM